MGRIFPFLAGILGGMDAPATANLGAKNFVLADAFIPLFYFILII
jgi:hypothetical protein